MQQSLNAASQIDERAKVAHRRDAAGDHCAFDNRLPNFRRARLLLLFEQRTSRDDDVPAPFLVFDDTEPVDAPFVLRRLGVAGRISIWEKGQKPRWRAMRTSYPPFTVRSTLPSTGRPE